MNNETEIEFEDADVPANILLPEDKDFIITRTNDDYQKKVNVTCRWPRKLGDATVLLVSTSTIAANALNRLRVEEVDGQFFVVNDTLSSHEQPTRFCVESEKVGHSIIKAIITEHSSKKITKDDLGIDRKYWKLNKIAEEFSALIFTVCGITLTFAASFWLLFR